MTHLQLTLKCFSVLCEWFYAILPCCIVILSSGVPRNFFRGGVQQIQLRTEDREDGDLGAVAP